MVALCLVALGLAALALVGGSLARSRFERYHFAAAALGALAGVIQVFALLVYLS